VGEPGSRLSGKAEGRDKCMAFRITRYVKIVGRGFPLYKRVKARWASLTRLLASASPRPQAIMTRSNDRLAST